MKIDRRKAYYLTIDTETANTIERPFVFDIGGVVHDKTGEVMETFSFIVREVFDGMPQLMETCYYQSKLPTYRQEIAEGLRQIVSWYIVKQHVAQLCEKYNIRAIIAHNMAFDYRAVHTTQRYLTDNKYRYFFPYGIEIWDTLSMSRDTIAKQKSYAKFCDTHKLVTRTGRPRLTAEVLYKYITNNNNFQESHTGLEDALIEKEIFARCVRQHKKMKKSPWKG